MQGLRGPLPQQPAPDGLIQRCFGIGGDVLRGPVPVEGMVAQKAVQKQQRGHDPAVIPAAGKQLDEPHEGRLGLFVLLIQQLLQHRRLQKLVLPIPAQGHIAGQSQRLEVLPDEPVAKGMDGADLGVAQQEALPPQHGVFRLLLHSLVQPDRDSLPHFLRRGIGEGHNKQPVDIHRALRVGDEGQHPFGQHSGLAAARRRRDQKISAPGGDGLFLGRGPFARAHSVSSFPPSSRCGASGSVLLHSPT